MASEKDNYYDQYDLNNLYYNHHQNLVQGFDHHHPSSHGTSFTDCLNGGFMDYNALSRAFDLSCSSASEVISSSINDDQLNPKKPSSAATSPMATDAGDSQVGPNNSSVSNSSSNNEEAEEAVVTEEDSAKSFKQDKGQDGDQMSKKENKAKGNKKEKKPREPRFAFLTKSEVDHLEDGYRWRKYGQKAVKNSPYPRSYYRCTSQKCNVKKRVERSFQDPSIVVTTYEGQHNHHCPATLRGSANAAMMLSSAVATPSLFGSSLVGRTTMFPQELLAQFLPSYSQGDNNDHHHHQSHPMFHQNPNNTHHHHHQQQQHQVPHDYGLLQDLLPPSSSSVPGRQQEP
ncbi:WRKY transcription factor 71-like [Prosopis cineraria]|uniref:WRKY transcription factor 71-like n=1 Tax=Prosopis cineraria TaxID=364024 RepID=UPI00240EED5E|nr:WRKY transcription factor 71-like [Prosopis cineraria]